MHTAFIEPRFESWRDKAREFLEAGISPHSLYWEDGTGGEQSLFSRAENPVKVSPVSISATPPKIPRAFFEIAKIAACHRSPERWAVLYRIAFRIVRGGDKNLLKKRTDRDVNRLEDWASAVRRDIHKMKAFVRFRKVDIAGQAKSSTEVSPSALREHYVAWFEPEHHIVETTAPFFAKRFAGMDWSILTPDRCAHWDGASLTFTQGGERSETPTDDSLEDYWRSYYAHIFNPARLKLKAMQSEMPKKYWQNLPEAPLIAELTSRALPRISYMLEAPPSARSHVSERIPEGVPDPEPSYTQDTPESFLAQADDLTLDQFRDLSATCQACPLHGRATQTVFGEGPDNAEIMIVGEQPGDAEDIRGRPFLGPAGRLLDEALNEVGINRSETYVTNTVKHFKWKREGKRRLHQNPSSGEVHTCRPWLLAELFKVRPRTVICLGSTAAQALIRRDFKLTVERGVVADSEIADQVIATFHPAYILRIPKREQNRVRLQWVSDLKLALQGKLIG